jgi:peptidoglycan/LPS O-acetylase OafA/YrhL
MAIETRLLWLDLIRGLSALAVAAGHLRLVMMCNYTDLPEPALHQTAFYVLTGLSSQAVMVFFVLSGFLVGGSALRSGERFQFGDYFLSRIVRLWVVLIPALLWTLFVDSITNSLDPKLATSGYFDRWTSGPAPGTYSLSLMTFLGNLGFVNTIYVPSYGSNGPLWSLACEFWYYILFPLLARTAGLIGERPQWWQRGLYAALAGGILYLMPLTMALGFLVWLLGVGVAVLAKRWPQLPSRWSVTLAFIGFILSLVYSKLDHFGYVLPVHPRYAVGICFALLTLKLVRVQRFPRWLRWSAINLAEISYSFYLVHFPVTVLIGVTVYSTRERHAELRDLLEYAAWFLGLILLSVPFWWIFERQTNRIRNLIRNLQMTGSVETGLKVPMAPNTSTIPRPGFEPGT